MQRQALIDAGVPEQQIEIIPDEERAVQTAMEQAGTGDLLLVFGDDIERCWRQITEYHSDDERPQTATSPTQLDFEPQEVPAVALGSGEHLIRDERGVRLARVEELED